MTIIIFLVDTSASMNQKTYLGTTLLDIAKGAIENFIKIRARDVNSRWDRYMLLTFEDPPSNIKAGWKESHVTFMTELKNLTAVGLTNLGPSLKYTFDLLNVNRMQTGIDTYGQGRCPYYLEPAVIICITDGRRMTTTAGVQSELNLPMNNAVPGSELTKEPFRWDQRIFGLVLRIPAVPTLDNPSQFISSAEDSPIDAMCEVTGGRSYCITTQRMLQQCVESLVQKCQSGVVINFEKIGPDPVDADDKDERIRSNVPLSAWQNCRRMIYVPRSVQKGIPIGHWPIPEAFWPDLMTGSLPPRNAQPIVKFTCTAADAMALENLPFDKYELEASPLTQYILERRQPNVAWQTFISGSAKYSDGVGPPFGYLKASSNLQSVNLYVMPYNYPVLIPLLDELVKVHMSKANANWRQKFENYVKTMPIYYAGPLKRALARLGPGLPALVPDQAAEQCLNYSVVSYLKKLKNQAKAEFDRVNASVGQRAIVVEGIKITQRTSTSIIERKNFPQLLEACKGDLNQLKHELTDYNTFLLRLPDPNVKLQLFKNPYDISRSKLIDQLAKMRLNFLKDKLRGRLEEAEWLHNQAVQRMGNYQDYLKKIPPPLREIDITPSRLHTFGNPFKVNKNLMIDEADEAMPGQTPNRKRASDVNPASPRPNKRKPGPLPKDVPARKLMSPTPHAANNDQEAVSVISSSPSSPPPSPTSSNFSDISFSNHVGSNDLDGTDTRLHLDSNRSKSKETLSTLFAVNGVSPSAAGAGVSVEEGNMRRQQQAFKEVRRPGQDYSQLFAVLQSLQGSVEVQQACVEAVRLEALRFKRRTLASQIEQFQTTLTRSLKPSVKSHFSRPTATS